MLFAPSAAPLADFLPLPTIGDTFVPVPWNEGLLGVT